MFVAQIGPEQSQFQTKLSIKTMSSGVHSVASVGLNMATRK